MKINTFSCGLNVAGKNCWVIGNDAEAKDKTQKLKAAGAHVTVVDPEHFILDDLEGQFFVVYCPTSDPQKTKAVSKRCRDKRILLCAIDQADFCDVVNVSQFQRGNLKISISTNGIAPAAAKKIRQGLESSLDKEPIEEFFNFLEKSRERLEKEISDQKERRKKLIELVRGFEFKASIKIPKKS